MRARVAMVGLLAAVVCTCLRAADAVPSEMEVRAAEAAARKAETELAEARAANRLLVRRETALRTTAELMDGTRATPPTLQIEEKEVVRLATEPVTLDNRADGKRAIWSQWLKLTGNRRYRVYVKLAIAEISGTQNFKFGMMVPRVGQSTDWPAAAVGGLPFAEKELHVDYFMPEGASNLFVLGFETGKGRATFRDVRVCELTEVLK